MLPDTDPDSLDRRFADLALLEAQADGVAMRLAGLSRHLRDMSATPMVTRDASGHGRALTVVGLAGVMLLVA